MMFLNRLTTRFQQLIFIVLLSSTLLILPVLSQSTNCPPPPFQISSSASLTGYFCYGYQLTILNSGDYDSIQVDGMIMEYNSNGQQYRTSKSGTYTFTYYNKDKTCSGNYQIVVSIPSLVIGSPGPNTCTNSLIPISFENYSKILNSSITIQPNNAPLFGQSTNQPNYMVEQNTPYNINLKINQSGSSVGSSYDCSYPLFIDSSNSINNDHNIIISSSLCNTNTGMITVTNYNEYISIKLYDSNTNQLITTGTGNGEFNTLKSGSYWLELESNTCGIERVRNLLVETRQPTIIMKFADTSDQGACPPSLYNVSFSFADNYQDPNASFLIDKIQTASVGQVISVSTQSTKVTYTGNGCQLTQTFPIGSNNPILPMSHTLSNHLSCQNPKVNITLQFPPNAGLKQYPFILDTTSAPLNSLVNLFNGTLMFEGKFGHSYDFSDGCDIGHYIIAPNRIKPVANIAYTSPSCLGVASLSVVNYLAFSKITVYLQNDNTTLYIIPITNGILPQSIPRGIWVLETMESGDCTNDPSLKPLQTILDLTVNVRPSDLASISIDVAEIVQVPSCTQPGKLVVRPLLYEEIGPAFTVTYNNVDMDNVINVPGCGKIIFKSPASHSVPPFTYSVTTQPSCQYSNDGRVFVNHPNGIGSIFINGVLGVPDSSNNSLYYVSSTNQITVTPSTCVSMGIVLTSQVNTNPVTNFNLNYTITPHSPNGCNTSPPNGIVTLHNISQYTSSSLNGLNPTINSTTNQGVWTGKSGYNFQLRFNSPICSGFIPIDIITSPLAFQTILTTLLNPSSTNDNNYLPGDGAYTFSSSNNYVLSIADITYGNVDTTNRRIYQLPYKPALVYGTFKNGSCYNKVYFPAFIPNTTPIAEFQVTRFPDCIDNGVILITNPIYKDIYPFKSINIISYNGGSSVPRLVNNQIIGWDRYLVNITISIVYNDNNIQQTVSYLIPSPPNGGDSYYDQVEQDDLPKFTVQSIDQDPFQCARQLGYIVSIDSDWNIDRYVSIDGKTPDQNGKIILSQKDRTELYKFHTINFKTLCSRVSSQWIDLSSYIVDNYNNGSMMPSITVVNETCRGNSNGQIKIESLSNNYNFQLQDKDGQEYPLNNLQAGDYVLKVSSGDNILCSSAVKTITIGFDDPILSVGIAECSNISNYNHSLPSYTIAVITNSQTTTYQDVTITFSPFINNDTEIDVSNTVLTSGNEYTTDTLIPGLYFINAVILDSSCPRNLTTLLRVPVNQECVAPEPSDHDSDDNTNRNKLIIGLVVGLGGGLAVAGGIAKIIHSKKKRSHPKSVKMSNL